MLKKFWKHEQGSVMVLTALAMVAMIGMTSLVVDVGSMVNQRSIIQNAADAAALAAVVEPYDRQAEVAKAYVLRNTTGVAEEDIIVTQLVNGDVQVDIKKDTKAFFSQILTGSNTNTVGAHAVARFVESFNASEVALWAKQHVTLNNSATVVGTVYSDGGDGSVTMKTGASASAVITSGQLMPDYSYLLDSNQNPKLVVLSKSKLEKKGNGYKITDTKAEELLSLYPSDSVFCFSDLDSNLVIDTSLILNIVTDGNIEFNGSGAQVDAMILYSTNGDITFNGSGSETKVLLYAPNGDVKMQSAGHSVSGSIVAQNITLGNGSLVTFRDMGLNPGVEGKPKLVE